jgi:hypothetical protein
VSVHPHHRDDELEQELRSTTDRLARFAAQHGLALVGVFSDVRGRTESGLYHLLAELRRGNAVAVLVPDLEHLQHAGCLAGADVRTATRYLRARVLPLAPASQRAPLLAGRRAPADSGHGPALRYCPGAAVRS